MCLNEVNEHLVHKYMKRCGIWISSKKLFDRMLTSYMCKYVDILAYLTFTYINNVYFNATMLNRLGRLTPSKHRLNRLNPKQRVTDCLPFSV